MTTEHFFNGPNRTTFEHRKIAKILVNNVKSGLFGHSKRENSAVFQDINLKFYTHIRRQVFLHIIPVFENSIFLENFGKQKYLITIFLDLKLKNSKSEMSI